MKNLSFFLIFLLFPLLSEAQSASIRKFYRNHKRDADVTHLYIPGFVVKTASLFAETKAQRRLLRKLGGVRVLMSEKQGIPKEEYRNFIKNVRNDKFDDFIQVKDDGDAVNVMIREQEDIIRGVLISVKDSDEGFVLVSAKSKIKTEELMQLVEMVKK